MPKTNKKPAMPNIPMDPISVKVGGKMIRVPLLHNEEAESLIQTYIRTNNLVDLSAAVEALRNGMVFLPGRIDEQRRISAAILHNSAGQSLIAVYTSASQITEKAPEIASLVPIPFAVAAELVVNLLKNEQKIDGIVINPVTMNLRITTKLVELIHNADLESRASGEKKMVDLGIKPVPIPAIDNKKVEELAIAFRDETDQAQKGQILNNILNTLYAADVVLRIGTDSNGKEAPEIMVHKENQSKRFPMYTAANVAVKPGEHKKISILPFKAALEYCLKMGEDIQGIVLITPDTALTLDRPLLLRVAEVNKQRDEMTSQAQSQVEKLQQNIEGNPEELDEAARAMAEHQKFELFFLPEKMREEGQAFIDQLISRREEYVDELFEASYYDILMYPYLPEEFAVMTLTTDDGLDAICIDFPSRDQGVACAANAYIIWDRAAGKGRYFAITRGMNRQLALIEQLEDGSVPHGPAPKDGNELNTILGIVKRQ